MDKKDEKEFFDKYKHNISKIKLKNILKWIESKKEEWQLLAFHDGYQTREDENEMVNRPVRSDKAIRAMQHKTEKYKKIISLKSNSKQELYNRYNQEL